MPEKPGEPAPPPGKPEAGGLRPTVIAPAGDRARRRKPAAADQASVPNPQSGSTRTRELGRAALGPTAIPGTERKRLEVTAGELLRLSPASTPVVIDEAIRLLQAVVIQGDGERQAVLWGHRLQKSYGDMVSRVLELSQTDQLKRAATHVGRMTELLGAIDLQALTGTTARASAFGRYFSGFNARVDTPEELARTVQELDQLVQLLSGSMDGLLSIKRDLSDVARKIDGLAVELEASALAADFLASQFRPTRPHLAERYIERSISLTQTVTQIRANAVLRDLQVAQPLSLLAAIQNVVLVTVPGWLATISGLLTMTTGKRAVTLTQTRELEDQLRTILGQLKG